MNQVEKVKILAKQGDANAQLELGRMYFHGNVLPRDYGKAINWFIKAAEQGYAEAQFKLGTIYSEGQGVPQNDVLSLMWIYLSAESESSKVKAFTEALKFALELRMSPAQVAEAKKLAREWKPKK